MVTHVADSEEDAPRMPSFSFLLVDLSSSPELNAITDFPRLSHWTTAICRLTGLLGWTCRGGELWAGSRRTSCPLNGPQGPGSRCGGQGMKEKKEESALSSCAAGMGVGGVEL